MPLSQAHPARLADKELQRLLADSGQALARSTARLQQSQAALIRAHRDNDHQRGQLAESRRAISLLK
jgi:hypothetical protein